MRITFLAGLGWLGVLQSLAVPAAGLQTTARLAGMAAALGTLTVLVYRLGVWRQEMENTRSNIGVEMRAHRRESAANFSRLERRLDSIDQVIAAWTPRG